VSKWTKGIILAVLCALMYEVSCEGYQRQVHVDQLSPAVSPRATLVSPNAVPLEHSITQEPTAHPTVVELDTPPVIDLPNSSHNDNVPETADHSTLSNSTQRHSTRNVNKPKRLIEEEDM